ncbi:MAG: hypothetical protein QM817_35880 [Archangium sp.]
MSKLINSADSAFFSRNSDSQYRRSGRGEGPSARGSERRLSMHAFTFSQHGVPAKDNAATLARNI